MPSKADCMSVVAVSAVTTAPGKAEDRRGNLRWQVEWSQIHALHALQQSSKVCRFCTVQQAFKRSGKTSNGCHDMQVHVVATRRCEVSVVTLVGATLGTSCSSSWLCTGLQKGANSFPIAIQ